MTNYSEHACMGQFENIYVLNAKKYEGEGERAEKWRGRLNNVSC